MGKKFFIRKTEKIEDTIRDLQAEVARLNATPRVIVYSSSSSPAPSPEPPKTVEEEPEVQLKLPSLEDDEVFIPTQITQGSADLKSLQKKTTRFEIKDIESLKTKAKVK